MKYLLIIAIAFAVSCNKKDEDPVLCSGISQTGVWENDEIILGIYDTCKGQWNSFTPVSCQASFNFTRPDSSNMTTVTITESDDDYCGSVGDVMSCSIGVASNVLTLDCGADKLAFQRK